MMHCFNTGLGNLRKTAKCLQRRVQLLKLMKLAKLKKKFWGSIPTVYVSKQIEFWYECIWALVYHAFFSSTNIIRVMKEGQITLSRVVIARVAILLLESVIRFSSSMLQAVTAAGCFMATYQIQSLSIIYFKINFFVFAFDIHVDGLGNNLSCQFKIFVLPVKCLQSLTLK